MAQSGTLYVVAVMALAAGRAGATPPPPPGGYVYYNMSPGVLAPGGEMIDQMSAGILVGTTVDGAMEDAGTLETRVYREEGAGTLDFVFHITPAASGEMLHSLDVPWVNNEVALWDAGYVSGGDGEISPVTIARYDDGDPVTFLFDYSMEPGASNLDGGTAWLVLKTNAHAYEWSDGLEARAIVAGGFEFTNGLGGFVPEHAPEPGSLGILGVGAVGLLRRKR